eukprot:CAMPEP_0170468336 /NCGR_PEP_ID=MMETSP0123-20130129/11557_1 /TAXON_ID=182087 /ORGANISM="Favella ehrenbergii, Strain Fehren 1" /LENGTH=53 /DNA_ID=CAMNT_0010734885 /DNA_START=146 /DNA_END=307 /DNA_ORIENTATION=-
MVYYWVPEDKDELGMPNAFIIRKALPEITLEMIENEFPMRGEFVFRFKYSHTG